jgi:hypothetical protein
MKFDDSEALKFLSICASFLCVLVFEQQEKWIKNYQLFRIGGTWSGFCGTYFICQHSANRHT